LGRVKAQQAVSDMIGPPVFRCSGVQAFKRSGAARYLCEHEQERE
jgi:hypothetical protein